jgi:hypothetical protein
MTPVHLRENIYAAKVPEGAESWRVECVPSVGIFELQFFKTSYDLDFFGDTHEFKIIDLPPGTWKIICTSKEIDTGKLAEALGYAFVGIQYAKELIGSLLSSKGLDTDKNYCIIQKM